MKDCKWKEYVCLLEEEIAKLVDYEVHHGLSPEREAIMHHLTENCKHAKEMMHDKHMMKHEDMAPNPNSPY